MTDWWSSSPLVKGEEKKWWESSPVVDDEKATWPGRVKAVGAGLVQGVAGLPDLAASAINSRIDKASSPEVVEAKKKFRRDLGLKDTVGETLTFGYEPKGDERYWQTVASFLPFSGALRGATQGAGALANALKSGFWGAAVPGVGSEGAADTVAAFGGGEGLQNAGRVAGSFLGMGPRALSVTPDQARARQASIAAGVEPIWPQTLNNQGLLAKRGRQGTYRSLNEEQDAAIVRSLADKSGLPAPEGITFTNEALGRPRGWFEKLQAKFGPKQPMWTNEIAEADPSRIIKGRAVATPEGLELTKPPTLQPPTEEALRAERNYARGNILKEAALEANTPHPHRSIVRRKDLSRDYPTAHDEIRKEIEVFDKALPPIPGPEKPSFLRQVGYHITPLGVSMAAAGPLAYYGHDWGTSLGGAAGAYAGYMGGRGLHKLTRGAVANPVRRELDRSWPIRNDPNAAIIRGLIAAGNTDE